MTDRARRHLWLLFAGLLLLVPYREFFSDRVPVARDLLFYFYPAKASLAEAVRAGEVPWIDRYRWGGVPLLSAPGAAPFDPLNVLFFFVPLGAAAKTWILIRLLTGLAGFWAFSRRIGLSPAAAASAGLFFALSGPTASLAPFLGASAAHSLLPWLAAFLLDLRRAPGSVPAARLAVVAALIVVAGAPEYVLYAALTAVTLVFGRWTDDPGSPSAPAGRVAAAVLLAGVLAAALAAPAILTGVTTVSESSRTAEGGFRLEAAAAGSLPPARLVELLSDGLLADWTRTLSLPRFGSYYPYLPSITPGRLALLFSLGGLVFGGSGRLKAAGLAGIGLLLAVGPATPVWEVAARAAPFVASIRYPERHLLLSGFAFAWLAALGLRALDRRLVPRAAAPVFALLALATLVDREAVARRICFTEPAAILTSRPAALAALSAPAPGASPPRLLHRDSLVPVSRFTGLDAIAGNRLGAELLMPEYPALFGVASLFFWDYDLTLPVEALEWTRLLSTALPQSSPLPLRFLRAAGVGAIERSEPLPGGGWIARVVPLEGMLPPWRFAARVVSDPDGRALFRRLLDEGIDARSAYVQDEPASVVVPAAGRIVSVNDGAGALELVAEVDGPGDGFLMLWRLHFACREATLDGRRTPVARMGFGFAGVRVPAGRHVVRLRPDTRWVKIGLMVTLAGASILAALVVRARRRPEGPPAG